MTTNQKYPGLVKSKVNTLSFFFIIIVYTANLNTLPDSGSESDAESESESDIDAEAIDEDKLATIEEEPAEIDTKGFVSMMQSAMDIFHEQKANGNIKFVEKFIAANAMNQHLVEEIQRLKNRHTIPLTWARNRHPATMYYRQALACKDI